MSAAPLSPTGSVRPTSWLARLRRVRALERDPARIGDAAVLKAELLGAPMSAAAEAAVEQLRARRGDAVLRPRIDLAGLRGLPADSFGRAFADFCDANRIVPAGVSDEFTDDDLRRAAAVVRYIAIHDMIHVLIGSDTTIPGELTVGAFVLQQGFFARSRLVLAVLPTLAAIARPHQPRRVLAAIRRGRALARRAPMLLAEPLEDAFPDPLERVRERLGLGPLA